MAAGAEPLLAVKALQRELKVKADGSIGPLTLDALKLRIAAAGVALPSLALATGVFDVGYFRRRRERKLGSGRHYFSGYALGDLP